MPNSFCITIKPMTTLPSRYYYSSLQKRKLSSIESARDILGHTAERALNRSWPDSLLCLLTLFLHVVLSTFPLLPVSILCGLHTTVLVFIMALVSAVADVLMSRIYTCLHDVSHLRIWTSWSNGYTYLSSFPGLESKSLWEKR